MLEPTEEEEEAMRTMRTKGEGGKPYCRLEQRKKKGDEKQRKVNRHDGKWIDTRATPKEIVQKRHIKS
jgi:hypothetical protein